ncbi:LIGHT-HARVESTING COMPLEX-LIKE PROTEIN OHP1 CHLOROPLASTIC [Salix viminalis]|uniref:LIGHT-HARVESTING COMPLEX-LIKE PROTEIN OHP1 CHLOROPLASTIC n=1 Tax=Salix viminalis TaxID=40686 RepID=A0A9Q0ZPP3_SALVM|nr:LIGHT-HARVESTING COMPLEX-LIKE PROTEIN OHP1 CHLOROPLASTIC [Salix viminalis]
MGMDKGVVERSHKLKMATSSSLISSSFLLPTKPVTLHPRNGKASLFNHRPQITKTSKQPVFRVQAAKLPPGVELPKVEPKFQAPFLGFTRTAEIWNSRACMIGLIGVFVVELIINKGILQVIGVDIGKGLDLPL